MSSSATEVSTMKNINTTMLTLTREEIASIDSPELLTFLAEESAQYAESKCKMSKKNITESEIFSLTPNMNANIKTSNIESNNCAVIKESNSSSCSNNNDHYDDNVSTSINLEDEIAHLQTDIETFITAVDEDGKRYNICLNNSGCVSVPLDESMYANVNNEDEQSMTNLNDNYKESSNNEEEEEKQQQQQWEKENENSHYNEDDEELLEQQCESEHSSTLHLSSYKHESEHHKVADKNNKREFEESEKEHEEEEEGKLFNTNANTNKETQRQEWNISALGVERERNVCDSTFKSSVQQEINSISVHSPSTKAAAVVAVKEHLSKQELSASNSNQISSTKDVTTTLHKEEKQKLKQKEKQKNAVEKIVNRLKREPKYIVHSRDILRKDEQEQVEALLTEHELTAETQIENPYIYSNAVRTRLNEIDEKLQELHQLRNYEHEHMEEFQDNSSISQLCNTNLTTSSCAISTVNSCTSESSNMTRELGNTYLITARQRQERLRKVRKINDQLRRIHEFTQDADIYSYHQELPQSNENNGNVITVKSSDNNDNSSKENRKENNDTNTVNKLMNELRELRPQWYTNMCDQGVTYTTLKGSKFTANEQEVQVLINQAIMEQNKANVQVAKNNESENRYSILRDEVQETLERAKKFMEREGINTLNNQLTNNNNNNNRRIE